MRGERVSEVLRERLSPEVFDKALERALEIEGACERLGVRVLALKELSSPLLAMEDAPVVLFVKGEPTALERRCVAVVGTRKPSAFGRRSASRLGRVFAERQFVVVSGLAAGCDTAAHEGCLDASGITVAVLAHGLDTVYPAANRQLAERIVAEGGALVSEYPPGTKPQGFQFVERDRIQAGLSLATVVVETSANGGTMHTARYALANGRRLGCVVRPVETPSNSGNRRLLESGQAVAIDSPESLEALISSL